MNNLKDAQTNTPSPSLAWQKLSDAERLTLVNDALHAKTAALSSNVVIVSANQDGQIIVNLLESLPAGKRGTLLLDLEAFLKGSIEQSLTVWLEPLGDLNSLRNLRGIEVKA